MNNSPSEYIARIEEMFDRCRRDGLDRFSVEWGKFSHDMNDQLRIDMHNARDRKLRSRYNFVFVFWIEMSKCLQQIIPNLKMANQMKEQALSKDPFVDFDLNDQERMGIVSESQDGSH